MSVRAYRIITKEVADQASFNLWHDTDLLDFFEENGELGYQNRRDENGGDVEINIDLLQKALDSFKWEEKDYRIEAIKADIAFAIKNNTDWVQYECY